ncbi:uncharacterized protein C6orf136 homolog isoform X1 [Columba livia]|uniref:uncharacterized protein C6orf136 homolog isoform X1 n=1 Tax=Columba livia TaxID=8932 RepID=UPI0031BAF13E
MRVPPVTFPSGPAPPSPRRRSGSAGVRGSGGGSAMYRHGRAAAAAAAARLRSAAPPLRAWSPPGAAAPAADPPRRRYRARPQDLSPPEGLGGDITTVDGHREDDIAVRDAVPPPAPPALLLLLRGHAPLLAPPGPPRPPPTMDEHLAAMHQKLQHELPNFFLKIPDYGLYAPDVEFINPVLRLHTRGRPMYAVAVALCRAVAWGYFASVRLEVLALTRHREDWSLRARWRLTGLPLHLCLLRFYRRDKGQLLRSYDAFSTFFLNSQGLIRCHRVDKMMPTPRDVTEDKKLLVAAVTAALGPALTGDTGVPKVSPLSPPP